jgi:hypothetical protein
MNTAVTNVALADHASWRRRMRSGLPDAVRMLIAAMLAYALAHALQLREAHWAVLSALITGRAQAGGTACRRGAIGCDDRWRGACVGRRRGARLADRRRRAAVRGARAAMPADYAQARVPCRAGCRVDRAVVRFDFRHRSARHRHLAHYRNRGWLTRVDRGIAAGISFSGTGKGKRSSRLDPASSCRVAAAVIEWRR